MAERSSLGWLSAFSLGAVAVGLLAGLGLRAAQLSPPEELFAWFGVAVRLWTDLLRLLLLPLVLPALYLATAGHELSWKKGARMGLATPVVFPAVYGVLAVFVVVGVSLTMKTPMLEGLDLSPSLAASPDPGGAAVRTTAAGSLLPSALLALASPSALLPGMLLAIGLALAARRRPGRAQQALTRGARAASRFSMAAVQRLLVVSPLVVLGVTFQTTVTSGLGVGRVLVAYAAIKILFLVGATALLYPLTAVAGGVSLARFARAVLPAQVAAAATRSSLATVPVLLEQAEKSLRYPRACSSAIIPLAGATLKLSRAVSDQALVVFLATLLHIPISLEQWVVFAAAVAPLSLSTTGVPRVFSGSRSLPAYVAIGLPAEYVLLLGTVTIVADVFMTILNTTGYMSVNLIVGRLAGYRIGEAAQPPATRVTTGTALADRAAF